ncbi:uncharacterized protein LOC128550115 [Mercenaria mercenaria]|uniref:uncharacterized protein LOC128550115 n=1 Tax=Mercenaria mercenaria TaxID=6596 RepID=UPI00234E52BF|nr:uncharacterized protein LOC128550115 [Mercenaria mercenaria]
MLKTWFRGIAAFLVFRSCSGVRDIDHAVKGSYSMDELQSLQSEINDIYEQLIDVSKKKGKILAETEEQKASILGRIKDLKKKMIDNIENMEILATETMNEKYSEVKKELGEDMSSVNKMIGKLEERKKKIDMAVQMDKGQRFIQVKLAQKAAADAKTLCKENTSRNHKVVIFTEDEGLSDAVMKKQAFGQINIAEQQKELEIKTVNMELHEDKFKCLIPDLCQLQDGSIIIVDQRNRNMKKLDKNYVAKYVCEFISEPTGICCTGKNEVAVKRKNNTIVFLTINGYNFDEHSLRYISVEDGGSWGMAYFAGDLWVSFRGGIRVYSLSGDLKDVITDVVGPFGEVIHLSPVHLAVRNNSIFIANGRDGALCLDKDGCLKYELQDDRLRFTRGVCVTRRGTVFLSGSQSNNVVMFNKDGGDCPLEMVSANRISQKGPVALLYDYTKNCLLITNNGSSSITVVD